MLPHGGRYELTWSTRVISDMDGHVNRIFIDAITGNEVFRYDDTQTQVATDEVGRGVGAAGDQLKLSAQRVGDRFRAVDIVLPGLNTTYDMKGDAGARAMRAGWARHPATTTTSRWTTTTPGAIRRWSSTHAYASLTYLYFDDKHGRRGINNNNLKLRLLVNPARLQDLAALGGQYPLSSRTLPTTETATWRSASAAPPTATSPPPSTSSPTRSPTG